MDYLLILQAVADGNWVFLKPLSVGKHEISLKGDTTNSNATNSTGVILLLLIPLLQLLLALIMMATLLLFLLDGILKLFIALP